MADQTIITGGFGEPAGVPPPGPSPTPGAINGCTINGYDYAGSVGVGLEISSVIANPTAVAFTLSEPAYLSGPALIAANWSITNVSGLHVTVLGVSLSGTTLMLTTTLHSNGDLYTLFPPIGVVGLTDGETFIPGYFYVYTGNGAGPGVTAVATDARHLDITYTAAPDPVQALVVSNYTINNGILVNSVVFANGFTYILGTSRLLPGVLYTVVSAVGPPM